MVGEICNRDADNNYGGRIDWAIFVGSTQIGNGTLLGLQANSCVEVSAPRQGNGTYSITATLVDEGNLLLQASCGELVCEDPVDPPETVDPPTGTPTVFIPVTGFDFSLGSLIPMIQNLGFALISVGLVLHGLSLNGNKKKKS